MFHVYDGGGVRATGPALLVRKSLADRVSLSASYYIDAVSNASIDVVTTASPFKEKRTAYDLGADYVVRDTTLSLGVSKQQRARLRRQRLQHGRRAGNLRRHDHGGAGLLALASTGSARRARPASSTTPSTGSTASA